MSRVDEHGRVVESTVLGEIARDFALGVAAAALGFALGLMVHPCERAHTSTPVRETDIGKQAAELTDISRHIRDELRVTADRLEAER